MPKIQREEMVDFLRQQILIRTGVPESDLTNGTTLSALGLSSLDAVLISGEVEDHFDLEIDPTTMFEYHTIDAITDRLIEVQQPGGATYTASR